MILLPATHIGGTVRCPEPLERIGHAGQLEVVGGVRGVGILVLAHVSIKPYGAPVRVLSPDTFRNNWCSCGRPHTPAGR